MEDPQGWASDLPLAWRVEQACFNAWPALHEVWVGDWIARSTPGVSRRANSADPLRIDPGGQDHVVAGCEAVYRAWKAPPLFRIPSLIGRAMERRLDRLGYLSEGETLTLVGEMGAGALSPDVEITPRPSRTWLLAKAAFMGFSPDQAAVYRRSLARLKLPSAFVLLRHEGRPASLAYGTIHDRLLCIESVATDQALRGRGLARRMLGALIAWAHANGIGAACLQVQADNDPATALYRRLGLTNEIYRYHYRRGPGD